MPRTLMPYAWASLPCTFVHQSNWNLVVVSPRSLLHEYRCVLNRIGPPASDQESSDRTTAILPPELSNSMSYCYVYS